MSGDATALDWSAFHVKTRGRPPRELLRRTLGCFELSQQPPGVAVDLGAGAGADTMELLRRGWDVHAVDAAPAGLEALRSRVPDDVLPRLHLHAARMEDFELPPCDMVWASYSLPYCPAGRWPALLRRIHAALRPSGRFAGDFFGERHAWAGEPGMFTLTQAALRTQLSALFEIEAFDVEDGIRPTGDDRLTHCHAFGVAVRRTACLALSGPRRACVRPAPT